MNLYMNDIALATFSNFDAGKHASERASQSGFIMDLYLGCWWKCEIFMSAFQSRKVGMEDTMILIPEIWIEML